MRPGIQRRPSEWRQKRTETQSVFILQRAMLINHSYLAFERQKPGISISATRSELVLFSCLLPHLHVYDVGTRRGCTEASHLPLVARFLHFQKESGLWLGATRRQAACAGVARGVSQHALGESAQVGGLSQNPVPMKESRF